MRLDGHRARQSLIGLSAHCANSYIPHVQHIIQYICAAGCRNLQCALSPIKLSGLMSTMHCSDDKIEHIFKLREPNLMKLLRQVVMILSWTLMLGEAAKPHYNKYCRPQEFDHEHIYTRESANFTRTANDLNHNIRSYFQYNS